MAKHKNKSIFRKQRKLADVQQHNERYERERLEALNTTPILTTRYMHPVVVNEG